MWLTLYGDYWDGRLSKLRESVVIIVDQVEYTMGEYGFSLADL